MNERPWLQHYPAGVPVSIDPSRFPTLKDYVEEKCREFATRPAFACMGVSLSFDEVDKKAEALAAYLQSRGLAPGDRMAIMMPNVLQYPIALFACLKAGLVIVNTNPLYTPREMEHQFTDSQVKGIIIAENFAANLEKVLGKTEIKVVITTTIGELLGSIKGTMVDAVIKYAKRMIPAFSIANTVSFKSALSQGKKFTVNCADSHPDTVVAHQYTGGTTGVSKGAMLTNKNLVANMLQIKAFLDPYVADNTGQAVVVCPLPLYHVFAFTCNCLAMMNIGALSVLITNPRDLSSIVAEFKRYKVTGITGVNTLYNALNNFEAFKTLDFSSLMFANAGATALQKSVADEWTKITGNIIAEGYGMTEASPVVTTNPKGGVRVGTIGIPIPSTDVRIVDDNGHPVTLGQAGEIQVKGPQVMKGYYNRPEETAKTITSDGWLNTGDVAIMEADGYFKIVDRKKDMILVSGFNVYPNEIEDVITMHPKVSEAAVIGVPDEKSGEVVKAFVILKDSTCKKDELIAYCRENLTGYKVPKSIEFVKELPKTNVGKILRRQLREQEIAKQK